MAARLSGLAQTDHAEAQNTLLTELPLDKAEQAFPGYMALSQPLFSIGQAPRSGPMPCRGPRCIPVELTAHPRLLYPLGDGGRRVFVALPGAGREGTDWRVSILQVAGSSDSSDDTLVTKRC